MKAGFSFSSFLLRLGGSLVSHLVGLGSGVVDGVGSLVTKLVGSGCGLVSSVCNVVACRFSGGLGSVLGLFRSGGKRQGGGRGGSQKRELAHVVNYSPWMSDP
ncbi:MAG: hypothetical protein VW935_05985 [Novosphingobium sp.]